MRIPELVLAAVPLIASVLAPVLVSEPVAEITPVNVRVFVLTLRLTVTAPAPVFSWMGLAIETLFAVPLT